MPYDHIQLHMKYGVQGTVYFMLIATGTLLDRPTSAATGSLVGTNIVITKDGGAVATSTNTGTYIGNGIYQLVLTNTELSAQHIFVAIPGSAGTLGTLVKGVAFHIQTYGAGSGTSYFGMDFGSTLNSQTIGTILNAVDLNPNQATATLGTVLAFTGIGSANVVQVLGTAASATSGIMNVNMIQVGGNATAVLNQRDAALSIVRGTAINGTLTTTKMSSDATETSDDHYKGRVLIFYGTGQLAGQASDVLAYNGTTKTFTFSTLTEAPGSGELWVLV